MVKGQSYLLCSSKGGTGKTTLAFHLSILYAKENPNESVLVIDTCSDINLSTTLLSGEHAVEYILPCGISVPDEHDSKCFLNHKTVGGYLNYKLNCTDAQHKRVSEFLTIPSNYNVHVPSNLKLLCGDQYIDNIISQRRKETHDLFEDDTKNEVLLLKDFIEEYADTTEEQCTVFIDTSSHFSKLTELSIFAATRIIIPFYSDSFSRKSFSDILYFIFGLKNSGGQRKINENSFSRFAINNNLDLPKIYLVVNNKMHYYRQEPVKAYGEKAKEVWEYLDDLVLSQIGKYKIFESNYAEDYKCEVPDFYSQAICCLHIGCSFDKLPVEVGIDNEIVRCDPERIYMDKLLKIVEKLKTPKKDPITEFDSEVVQLCEPDRTLPRQLHTPQHHQPPILQNSVFPFNPIPTPPMTPTNIEDKDVNNSLRIPSFGRQYLPYLQMPPGNLQPVPIYQINGPFWYGGPPMTPHQMPPCNF